MRERMFCVVTRKAFLTATAAVVASPVGEKLPHRSVESVCVELTHLPVWVIAGFAQLW